MSSGGLRLIAEARDLDARSSGRLTVTLHSAISGRPLQSLIEDRGAGADTILVAANPRVAFLHIDSESLEWNLRLDERVDGDPEGEQR